MDKFADSVLLNYGSTTVGFLSFNLERWCLENDYLIFHKHFCYEIHIATKGSHMYELWDREILLKNGEMLIIPPGVKHKNIDRKKKDYECRVIALNLSCEDRNDEFFLIFSSLLNKMSLNSVSFTKGLAEAAENICDNINDGNFLTALKLKKFAADFVYNLFFLGEADDIVIEGENADSTVLLETLINNQNITLNEIAHIINYSPRHTGRIIKKMYGKSLKEIREQFKYGKNGD